jgi:DNA polymerase-3 subunit gamma/tau
VLTTGLSRGPNIPGLALSYLVLARKSRPQLLEEVVGQEAVVRTLRNALEQQRVPHALIFSGVRGTGKTTLARILAKALNCEAGLTATPCNVCSSCRDIMAGTSVDLQEVDGASNRGIQEIRELKENIRFMPTGSRFKIILIDEVHMLTTEAFNALLKTLEEPPNHVYFIFATTELHKVPVTILSRCQRYELKRIGRRQMLDHFQHLAAGEGVSIEDGALELIVGEAAGSIRDGLSLLDQVFSYCGTAVKTDEVAEVLGLVSQSVISELGQALLAGDLNAALQGLDQVYAYGMDQKRFINELLSWCRSLLTCKVSKQPELLLDLPEEELHGLSVLAAKYSAETLMQLFDILLDSLERINFSTRPRLQIEMAFIRAIKAQEVYSVADLLGRLDRALAGADLSQMRVNAATNQGTTGHAVAAPGKQAQEKPEQQQSVVSGAALKKATAETATGPLHPPAWGEVKADTDASRPNNISTDQLKNKQPAKDVTAVGAIGDSGINEEPAEKATARKRVKDVRRHWNEFLDYVRQRKQWMALSLQRSDGARLEGNELVISFEDSADCRLLKNRENINMLTEYALDFFQGNFRVCFHTEDGDGCTLNDENGASPRMERQALANNPLVLAAVEIFNGEVGDIRVGPRFRGPMTDEKESDKS